MTGHLPVSKTTKQGLTQPGPSPQASFSVCIRWNVPGRTQEEPAVAVTSMAGHEKAEPLLDLLNCAPHQPANTSVRTGTTVSRSDSTIGCQGRPLSEATRCNPSVCP